MDNNLIPDHLQQRLLDEAWGLCSNPECNTSVTKEHSRLGHVFQPEIFSAENLLVLCKKCHTTYCEDQPPSATIQAWKILQLAQWDGMQTSPADLKLAALRNYTGLAPLFPDEHFPFPFAGGKIYLNIHESHMMFARALGMYEPDKSHVISTLFKPGMTFIDIGANKGDFSLIAAKIVGNEGKVLSFEPEPDNCRWIRKSIEMNNYTNIQLFDLALGSSNGEATLYIGEKSGWHSLVPNQAGRGMGEIEVTTRTLDSLLDEINNPDIDLIKIDVEGAEMEVLNGARETLSSNKDLTLLIDLHPHLGVNPIAVCNLLEENGFKIYNMDASFKEAVTPHMEIMEILARRP